MTLNGTCSSFKQMMPGGQNDFGCWESKFKKHDVCGIVRLPDGATATVVKFIKADESFGAWESTVMERDLEQKVDRRLEMSSRADLRPPERTTVEFEVKRVEIACPEFNWFLHQAVGVEFRWGGRESWGRREWAEYVNRSGLETWVAYVAGTPAGYYELEKQDDGSVRIECFGLRRPFFGQGLGGSLLTLAVERCWEMGAGRVWLTTCNHDHAHAVQNYLARGFKLVKEWTDAPNRPRESALFSPGRILSK